MTRRSGPASAAARLLATSGSTPSLEDAREALAADGNLWWAIGCGHHQNLFEEACEEIDRLRAELVRMQARAQPHNAHPRP